MVFNSGSSGIDVSTSGNSGIHFRDNEVNNKGYIVLNNDANKFEFKPS